jgi:LCP family protein required for cell wall assembly
MQTDPPPRTSVALLPRAGRGGWLPYGLVVPSKEKPYRVYRGGRVRGPIKPLPPLDPHGKPRAEPAGDGRRPGAAPPAEPPEPPQPPRPLEPGEEERRPKPRRRRVAFWIGIGLLVLVLVVVGWGTAGYLSLRSGVAEANERLPPSAAEALSPQRGSLLSSPSNILLLGTDLGPGRADSGRSDAIVLVRTDPDEHRLALLSVPRDLRVEIPGYGPDKVNAAYAFGGAALAIDTVESLTGLPVNHVAVVDFSTFGELIDALGGVTVDVPRRIVSNRFDCPYASQARCERWPGWQFPKGKQEMDGRRALVYARVRENTLDPNESDLTRGGRQQQVVQAIVDELAGFTGYLRMPFIGKDVMRPMATDLSATELLELGWVKLRSSSTLRCRLGGVPQEIDGAAYLVGTEENPGVVDMVLGRTAPQPPSRVLGPFAPGCEA